MYFGCTVIFIWEFDVKILISFLLEGIFQHFNPANQIIFQVLLAIFFIL